MRSVQSIPLLIKSLTLLLLTFLISPTAFAQVKSPGGVKGSSLWSENGDSSAYIGKIAMRYTTKNGVRYTINLD